MRCIDERARIKQAEKAKQKKKVTESDLRRAEAALTTYKGENSTAYQKAYLLKTIEELMPLFLQEIRDLRSELKGFRRSAKSVIDIYNSMKVTRTNSNLEKILSDAISKLLTGEIDE